jgi:predicted dehydrogenase
VSVVADMNHCYGDDAYQRYVSTFKAGVFYNLACHLIDFIVPMMDGELERATFSLGAAPGDPPESRNRCSAFLEWPSSVAQLRVCSRVPKGEQRRRLVVEGTNGVFELERIERFDKQPLKGALFLNQAAGAYVEGHNALDFGVQTDRYAGQLLELAEIIRGERPNPTALYDHDLRVHDVLLRTCGLV